MTVVCHGKSFAGPGKVQVNLNTDQPQPGQPQGGFNAVLDAADAKTFEIGDKYTLTIAPVTA